MVLVVLVDSPSSIGRDENKQEINIEIFLFGTTAVTAAAAVCCCCSIIVVPVKNKVLFVSTKNSDRSGDWSCYKNTPTPSLWERGIGYITYWVLLRVCI